MGAGLQGNGSESLFAGEGRPPLESANEGMKALFRLVRRVAAALATVLLEGKSGTGKELFARALHVHSPRRDRPFVALNCAAVTETLLESEIFGHVRGAFSWAIADKPGLVEVADTGTFFLDEVSEMPPPMQVKLLRMIEEKEFRRVGDVAPRHVDIAIIAATNKNLHDLVKEGRFRDDLYYRLKVDWIRIPPLRERVEDILCLAETFLREHTSSLHRPVLELSAEAKEFLLRYTWPGNIRELRNCMHHLVSTSEETGVGLEALEGYLGSLSSGSAEPPASEGILERLWREEIEAALKKHGGNRGEAARELDVDPKTLRKRMRKLGLE